MAESVVVVAEPQEEEFSNSNSSSSMEVDGVKKEDKGTMTVERQELNVKQRLSVSIHPLIY